MTSIAVVYHSAWGHTKKQAEAVHEGAQGVTSVTSHLISVTDIHDHWDKLHAAQAIIFGCPTYMGSASAAFKTFMDETSKYWKDQLWANKLAAGFTNSGSLNGDKLNTLTQLMIFAMQHSMLWVGLGLMGGNNSSHGSPEDLNRLGCFAGAMAQSNVDEGPDVAPPPADLKTAAYLGQRVAQAALKWHP